MTICRVLLLINGQNDKNPKSLHPIVASICMVMAVKKPCALYSSKRKPPYCLTSTLRPFKVEVLNHTTIYVTS